MPSTTVAPKVADLWLSVLVPVYRVEKYLEACIESVAVQYDGRFEVVLLDDGSPDRSYEIAIELSRRYPEFVRALRRDTNAGVSVVRNELMEHARGDYIWHVDSDDIVLAGAIGRLRNVVDLHAPDLVLCGFSLLGERPRPGDRSRRLRSFDGVGDQPDTDRSRLVAGLMRMRRLHPWSKVARRDVWKRARFPEGRSLMEDVAVIPALVAATRKFVHIDEPWIAYRQHEESALATLDATKILHALQTLAEMRATMTELDLLDLGAQLEVDYFILRSFGWIARNLSGVHRDDDLDHRCRATLDRIFPCGYRHLLKGRYAWAPWSVAGRLQRNLDRRQWA